MQLLAITITLINEFSQSISFEAGFNHAGEFFVEDESLPLDGITLHADFGGLVVNGDAWRDIEAGDYLQHFLGDVVFGERDADRELESYHESLNSNGSAGKCLGYALYSRQGRYLLGDNGEALPLNTME